MSELRFNLVQDRKGMAWDLLLYVPTVTALLSMAAKFWFGDDANLAYLLVFLGSFFFIAGANRILKTRLMLLPSAPVGIEIGKSTIRFALSGGGQTELVKDLRFYSDYAGKSFGLTGFDNAGQRQQFVFHKGQFPDVQGYQAIQDKLRSVCGS
ncbi:MAG: hypothetical protein HY306_00915 [Nitrosomonadales bacterium]|nr:hypothetical protein [Nitrosomonadales bacterium]